MSVTTKILVFDLNVGLTNESLFDKVKLRSFV